MVYGTQNIEELNNSVCLTQIHRKKVFFNPDICIVLVNGRKVGILRRHDMTITLKYVLKCLLGTMKIVLIFLVAIARTIIFLLRPFEI